ncbi:hypothetical protein [Inediibacterium massiliense]|uniref:hypothetical protein n=1 Tax=Inediibacterium massiliense TaxID=1658111 RepID=UPI0006B3FD29|nr:hypothetical protein [Inediibacterium massiliense]
MKSGKPKALLLRFIYGYLQGIIFISIIYIVVGITIILFDPEPFSIVVIKYTKTEGVSKLVPTLAGHVFMLFWGLIEWRRGQLELRKRKKKRRKIYE